MTFKKAIKYLIAVTVVIAVGFGVKYGMGLGKVDNKYTKDFDYIMDIYEKYDATLKFRKELYGTDFLKNRAEYRKEIEKCTIDEGFVRVMNDILKKTEDGHNFILPEMLYKQVNCRMTNLINQGDEERFIIKFKEQLNIIDNYPATKKVYHITDDMCKVVEDYNKAKYGNNTNGDNIERVTKLSKIGDNISYIKIPSFAGEVYDREKNKVAEFLKKVKNVPNMIIDVRGNPGGTSEYASFLISNIISESHSYTDYYFVNYDKSFDKSNLSIKYAEEFDMKKITKEDFEKLKLDDVTKEKIKDAKMLGSITTEIPPSKDSIKYKGNVYIIGDNNSQSAAFDLISVAKKTGTAKIIGKDIGISTTTGGQSMFLLLPNTGYVSMIPLRYSIPENGTIEDIFTVKPDIDVPANEYLSTHWHAKTLEEDKELYSLVNIINKK